MMLGQRFFSVMTAVLALATSTSAVMTDWETIHSVLHKFPMYVDIKDFGSLKNIFTADATANYTGKLSNLHGLVNITKALQNDTQGVVTQHLLGTTAIDISPRYIHPSQYMNTSSNAACGKANSTTYVQVMRFHVNATAHSNSGHVTLYGKYIDKFQRVGVNDWRICDRQWEFQGPGWLGNKTLLGQIGQK